MIVMWRATSDTLVFEALDTFTLWGCIGCTSVARDLGECQSVCTQ